jgi:hypothetical protein
LQGWLAVSSHAVIIYHNAWRSAAEAARTVLQNRGYEVRLTDRANEGLTRLRELHERLDRGDNLVVYLAGHGSNPRTQPGETARNLALNHYVEFNDGVLTVGQVAPVFEALSRKDINLTVIDGSCNGGETVYNAIDQRYCAVSTVGVYAPSLSGVPSIAAAMQKDPEKSTFGLWWSDPHMTASWMNGEIVSDRPERLSQRLYRNDSGEFAGLSLFIRPALHSLQSIGGGAGWFLWAWHCRLYRTIYPMEYSNLSSDDKNAYASLLLIDAETFISHTCSWVDPQIRFITRLQEYLSNQDLMKAAADVYDAWYERVWQTLSNDPEWNPVVDPRKYVEKMYGLTPAEYAGKEGFLQMVKELRNLIVLEQAAFAKQQELLRRIDDAAAFSPLAATPVKIPTSTAPTVTVPRPEDPRWSSSYNTFERKAAQELRALEKKAKISHIDLMQFVEKPVLDMTSDRESEARIVVDRSADVNKAHFVIKKRPRTSLSALISQFRAVSADLNWEQGRSSLILSIIEDAVNKVESGEHPTNPGDVIHY